MRNHDIEGNDTSKKYFILGFSHDVRSAILVSIYNKTVAKITSANGAKWTKDNLGTRRVNKAPFCTRARELAPCSVNAPLACQQALHEVQERGGVRALRRACSQVVSFAAVIRVVTRHATLLPTEERCVTSDDPNNGCEGD